MKLRLTRSNKIDGKAGDTVEVSPDRAAFLLRYGLADGVPHPQHEVADVLGISRSYVSRIEKKALEKLKRQLE